MDHYCSEHLAWSAVCCIVYMFRFSCIYYLDVHIYLSLPALISSCLRSGRSESNNSWVTKRYGEMHVEHPDVCQEHRWLSVTGLLLSEFSLPFLDQISLVHTFPVEFSLVWSRNGKLDSASLVYDF